MLHITYIIKKDPLFPYRQIIGDASNILFDIQTLNVKLLAANLKNTKKRWIIHRFFNRNI